MCLRPITIKNLNYGLGRKGLNWLKNTETTHIQVPCGTCIECCKRKQSFLYQRAAVESDSHFVFFQTLTIAPRHMMYVDFGGQTFRFFNYWYFQCYLKNIRKHQIFGEGTRFKYIAVVEYGGEKHRPHMHVLYFVPKDDKNYEYISKERDVETQNFLLDQKAHELFPQMLKYWRVNLNDQRDENGRKLRICSLNPKWDNLCDYRVSGKFRNFDFRAVEVSPDDSKNVCFYVSKYITKFDKWTTKLYHYLRNNARDQREFLDVWNLLRPRVFISKFFGVSNINTKEIIQKSIEYSLNPPSGQCDTWYFVDFTNGQVRTMSPYYRSKFLSLDDRISMWMFTDNPLNSCEDDIKNVELEKRERNENFFLLLVRQRNRADECFDVPEADDLLCELV